MQDELDPIQVSPKFKENLNINSKKRGEKGWGYGEGKKLKERRKRVSQSSEYHIHHLDAGRVRPYPSSTNLMRLGLIIFYSKMSLTIFLMSNLKKGKKEQTNLSVFTQPRIFTSKRRKLV